MIQSELLRVAGFPYHAGHVMTCSLANRNVRAPVIFPRESAQTDGCSP